MRTCLYKSTFDCGICKQCHSRAAVLVFDSGLKYKATALIPYRFLPKSDCFDLTALPSKDMQDESLSISGINRRRD